MQKTNESFTFGAEVSAGLCRSCISDTLKSFWNGFCCTASNITFVPQEENVLIIGDGEILPAEAGGCTIHVTEKGASVCANDRQSLLRGCMTLLQMIKPKCLDRGKERFQIPCCTVKDKPAVKNRMVHLCVFPETTLPFLQKFIRLCGALK